MLITVIRFEMVDFHKMTKLIKMLKQGNSEAGRILTLVLAIA